MSIFAEANSLVVLEEPVDDVFIEIKKADIRGGISAENVHIVSPYVGIVQIRYAGLSGCLLSAERLPVFVHFMIGRNRRLVKAGM